MQITFHGVSTVIQQSVIGAVLMVAFAIIAKVAVVALAMKLKAETKRR